MPFINIKLFKGALPEEKKKEMIARVSDVVAEIEASPHPKENLLPYTWCVIEEVEPSNWGVGGNPCSLELLASIVQGKG